MLKNFKLVDTTTKAIFFNGDTIRVEDINDVLAEKLIGKTHVLERLTPTPAVAVAQLAEASEPATAEAEAPATSRKRTSN